MHGLEGADLKAAAFIKSEGIIYRVLDPVAMLKAKAANIRDIGQAGPPPRQGRAHLHLIARCVPEFLRDVHQSAIADCNRERQALAVVRRAFKTLQNAKTSHILQLEGIAPATLIPGELRESPLARIRTAFEWQFRLLAALTRTSADRLELSTHRVRQRPTTDLA